MHANLIGQDVMANLSVHFTRLEPKFNSDDNVIGTRVTQVVECCPGGSIPDMIKTRLIQRQ